MASIQREPREIFKKQSRFASRPETSSRSKRCAGRRNSSNSGRVRNPFELQFYVNYQYAIYFIEKWGRKVKTKSIMSKRIQCFVVGHWRILCMGNQCFVVGHWSDFVPMKTVFFIIRLWLLMHWKRLCSRKFRFPLLNNFGRKKKVLHWKRLWSKEIRFRLLYDFFSKESFPTNRQANSRLKQLLKTEQEKQVKNEQEKQVENEENAMERNEASM